MGLFDAFETARNEMKREFRRKVDEAIHPDSNLGRVIHKVRKENDKREEKIKNREKSPRNITYVGEKKKRFQMADHLFVRAGLITHHGIYVGGNEVIHYSPDCKGKIKIHRVSLEKFADGREIRCLSEAESPLKYSRQEAVRRAFHRVDEQDYDLFGNNCENFVRWCRSGGEEWIWEED